MIKRRNVMRYKWHDIPALLQTPLGRLQFWEGVHYRLWPFFFHLASFYRRVICPNTRIVSVVGSFGKSTTLRAVHNTLGLHFQRLYLRNSWTLVARAVLRIRPHDRHAAIEAGIDGKGQMALYARMIRPDVTVVTSIGSEHNRSLGTLEVTRSEKAEMVRILPESGIAVLNGDDQNVVWMNSQTRARVITFGMNDMNDVRASDIRLDWPESAHFKLHLDGKTYDMKVRLLGRHMVYPILAAAAVAHAEGFPPDRFLQSLEDLTPTPGRIQPVHLENGAIILRDDFKSSLETIETALDVFSEIPAQRKIVVLGEVSEPPGSQGPIYWKIGERVAKIASRAVFIGGNFQRYAAGALRGGLPKHSVINAQRNVFNAVKALQDDLGTGDVVLIKGRDTQRLERIALALAGQTVRCDIDFCDAKVRCDLCPILKLGWKGRRIVI
jgi:UDP-N-acetylmuramoyl-tripeptide--D-alanyl-D-alanine ligase